MRCTSQPLPQRDGHSSRLEEVGEDMPWTWAGSRRRRRSGGALADYRIRIAVRFHARQAGPDDLQSKASMSS